MGYLRQKKHQARENIFLFFMAIVITGLTAGSFANAGFCYGFFNLFHLYCLSGLLFIYALLVKKYKISLFFALIFLINYTSLSASGNIFLSDHFEGREHLDLTFDVRQNLSDSLDKDQLSAAGSLIVAHRYVAPYVIIGKQKPLTLVRVDFRGANKEEYPLIFEHLHEFILKQDNPVIIFGEFGLPVWSKAFKHFLDATGLAVKNRLIFTKGAKYNIFTTPGFYVLGFPEMGISELSLRESNNQKIIKTTVSFNPEQP